MNHAQRIVAPNCSFNGSIIVGAKKEANGHLSIWSAPDYNTRSDAGKYSIWVTPSGPEAGVTVSSHDFTQVNTGYGSKSDRAAYDLNGNLKSVKIAAALLPHKDRTPGKPFFLFQARRETKEYAVFTFTSRGEYIVEYEGNQFSMDALQDQPIVKQMGGKAWDLFSQEETAVHKMLSDLSRDGHVSPPMPLKSSMPRANSGVNGDAPAFPKPPELRPSTAQQPSPPAPEAIKTDFGEFMGHKITNIRIAFRNAVWVNIEEPYIHILLEVNDYGTPHSASINAVPKFGHPTPDTLSETAYFPNYTLECVAFDFQVSSGRLINVQVIDVEGNAKLSNGDSLPPGLLHDSAFKQKCKDAWAYYNEMAHPLYLLAQEKRVQEVMGIKK